MQTELKKQFLKDYLPPAFWVKQVQMYFDINNNSEDLTILHTIQVLEKNENSSLNELFLNGEGFKLINIKAYKSLKPNSAIFDLNNLESKNQFSITDLKNKILSLSPLDPGPTEWSEFKLDYEQTPEGLRIKNPPAFFVLKITTELNPRTNTSLEGLYLSNQCIVTQCEAEGFRKLTYFQDRPDVMSRYQVLIEADSKTFPVLLSNGNKILDLNSERRLVGFDDPWKKPCYLFALVAGNLEFIQDKFITTSGKTVNLQIYAAPDKVSRCYFAMEALKKSFQWDQERFGREYDLSDYIIVAIDDFNAGAMENKGLNIFNSRLVLADPKTATDEDFLSIESVVAHEYFHNWTGNRVTLRNWFELSLKEGLTVFRDQEFSMDMLSRDVVRIDSVVDLRDKQFPEDAGPNAHPIRPLSCYAVDNFFTSTIYEKGSEVIRMMQTMVGRPGFRKGMDLYFDKYDGKAVTIEDFASCISQANEKDWSQFKLWYSQAGTPRVFVETDYFPGEKKWVLKLTQSCEPSSQEKLEGLVKKDFHIPLVFGLLDSKTKKEILLSESNNRDFEVNTEGQSLLNLTKEKQTFSFEYIDNPPVLSINRQFSAPIHLNKVESINDDLFLMAYDSDNFNRWESAQNIYSYFFKNELKQPGFIQLNESEFNSYLEILLNVLTNQNLDHSIKTHLMEAPSFAYLLQKVGTLNPVGFLTAKNLINQKISSFLEKSLYEIFQQVTAKSEPNFSNTNIGLRRLKYLCLNLLSYQSAYEPLVKETILQSETMSDLFQSFKIAVDLSEDLRNFAIQYFYDKQNHDNLIMNKWFTIQAQSFHANTLLKVQELYNHKKFNNKNPNNVYSLLRNFGNNLIRFNDQPEKSYYFLAEKILELDLINPQVATRVANSFNIVPSLSMHEKNIAKDVLCMMLKNKLSANTFEVISKCNQSL